MPGYFWWSSVHSKEDVVTVQVRHMNEMMRLMGMLLPSAPDPAVVVVPLAVVAPPGVNY